jgi:hypothetical protein
MTLLAYPCIGGPLAGEYVTSQDFLGGSRFLGGPPEPARHEDLAGEYLPYEWPAFRGGPSEGDFPPARVYLHQSVLKPTKKAGDR